jgi:hypothetical protein
MCNGAHIQLLCLMNNYMKSRIQPTIIFITGILCIYNLLYIYFFSLPDHVANYQLLSNLDSLHVLRIPSLFLSVNYFNTNIGEVLRNYLIDNENPFAIIPFLFSLFAIVHYFIFSKKNTLFVKLSVVYLLLNLIISFIELGLQQSTIPKQLSVSLFSSIILVWLLFFGIKKKTIKPELVEPEIATRFRIIIAYFIDVVFGLALMYLFSLSYLHEVLLGALPNIIFYLVVYKVSLFIYLLAFELLTDTTIGKFTMGVKTLSNENGSPTTISKIVFSLYQLIPFWYLFKNKSGHFIEQKTNTKTILLDKMIVFRLSAIILTILSFFIITTIQNIQSNNNSYYSTLTDLQNSSYSNVTPYDQDVNLIHISFSNKSHYIRIIKIEPLSDNLRVASSNLQPNQIDINLNIENMDEIQLFQLVLEKENGNQDVFKIQKFKNYEPKIQKIKV